MTKDSYEKKIDGEFYYAVDFAHNKPEALKIAKNWREKGYKVRIIKTREKSDIFYIIYTYPPPGEIPTVFTEYKR